MRHVLFLIIILFSSSFAFAENSAPSLPEAVKADVRQHSKNTAALEPVGDVTYRKLGFTIYHAVLWAPGGVYNPAKPYALQLRYARDLSRETLVDAVAGDVEEHEQPDEATMTTWTETLNSVLPSVKDEEELIGLDIPGQDSQLFFNGQKYSKMTDRRLSRAFFGIWLGDKADPNIRTKLTGQPQLAK